MKTATESLMLGIVRTAGAARVLIALSGLGRFEPIFVIGFAGVYAVGVIMTFGRRRPTGLRVLRAVALFIVLTMLYSIAIHTGGPHLSRTLLSLAADLVIVIASSRLLRAAPDHAVPERGRH